MGDIALGTGCALAVLLLCTLVVRVYGPNRWQRVVWAFKIPARTGPKIIVETISGEQTVLYRRPSAGFGAVAAVAQLSSALNASRSGLVRRMPRSLENPIELSFSSEEKADGWSSLADTVIVGGPKSNEITAEALRAFGCQPPAGDRVDDGEMLRRTGDLRAPTAAAPAGGLGVATQDNTIYWFGTAYKGDVGESDDPVPTGYKGADYGVVLRLPSPTNPDHRMVIVFGSQTFGVEAASSWLVKLRSRDGSRSVRSTMAKHRNVAVLVRAEINDGLLSDIQLRELVVLPNDLLPRHW
jgi:hypothetical protein